MPERRLVPLDGLFDAPRQGEADSEPVSTARACNGAFVVGLIECHSVHRFSVGIIEFLQEHILNVH